MGAALLVAGTVVACSGPWRDGYFKKGVDRLTQDEIKERLGPPHTAKTPALGGDSTWTYRVPLSERFSVGWGDHGEAGGRVEGDTVLLPVYAHLQ
jgi:hypothetical protein